MLTNTLKHLLDNVIPAANDYERAEIDLSNAFSRDNSEASWVAEGTLAKRRAAEVAIAIDGLADRAAIELGIDVNEIRRLVAPLCTIDGNLRDGCVERVCAVANAYKHSGPLRATHPIQSESDVLAAGAGFGIDGYGVGKFSGVEVLVNQRDGTRRKFLGDVPWAVAGWFRFLDARGASLPAEKVKVCNLCVKHGTLPQTEVASI